MTTNEQALNEINLRKTYTLTGSDICQVEELSQGRYFLRDLNRSKAWQGCTKRGVMVTQGYAQGYLINGDRLDYYAYDIADGRIKDRIEPQPTKYTVADLRGCDVETVVTDMAAWRTVLE